MNISKKWTIVEMPKHYIGKKGKARKKALEEHRKVLRKKKSSRKRKR